jgi:hypothetical protein
MKFIYHPIMVIIVVMIAITLYGVLLPFLISVPDTFTVIFGILTFIAASIAIIYYFIYLTKFYSQKIYDNEEKNN